jgi:hypothetical protein
MKGLQARGIILLSCIRKVKKVQQSERLKNSGTAKKGFRGLTWTRKG